MRMVKSGTVAFKIEATAESMDCSPHEIKKIGIARLVGPRMAKSRQVLESRGHSVLLMTAMATPASAPNNMRNATRAMGPISCTPILIQRNDELQIIPNKMKTTQCFDFIFTCKQVGKLRQSPMTKLAACKKNRRLTKLLKVSNQTLIIRTSIQQ